MLGIEPAFISRQTQGSDALSRSDPAECTPPSDFHAQFRCSLEN